MIQFKSYYVFNVICCLFDVLSMDLMNYKYLQWVITRSDRGDNKCTQIVVSINARVVQHVTRD